MHEIGWIETCYDEKFGIPRQSGVVGSAWGRVMFSEEFQSVDFIRGLDGFSYVWLIFLFHQSSGADGARAKAMVRPPRLGGNEKVGVFASRSPFRPNPIGLSLVRLERVETGGEDGTVLHVSGVDMVSGTPVLDIKPYISYCDSVEAGGGEAVTFGYVAGAPEAMPVVWGDVSVDDGMRVLISETLALDPRPAYHDDEREYGCLIDGVNVRWQVVDAASDGSDEELGGGRVVKILSCTKV